MFTQPGHSSLIDVENFDILLNEYSKSGQRRDTIMFSTQVLNTNRDNRETCPDPTYNIYAPPKSNVPKSNVPVVQKTKRWSERPV